MNRFGNQARSRSCRRARARDGGAACAAGWRFLLVGLLQAAAAPLLAQAALEEPANLLTNIQQVLALGNPALQTNPQPVRLRGVLTAISRENGLLFLQEGAAALSAEWRGLVEGYAPGQVLEVAGVAVASQVQPRIRAESARVVGTARLPGLKWGDVYKMMLGEGAFRYLIIRGVVRDLLLENEQLVLLVRHGGVLFRAVAPAPPGTGLPRELIDAEIDVRGACLHATDAQGAIQGFSLVMPDANHFKLQRPGTTNLFERPLTTIAEFHNRRADQFMRTRIAGTVLAHFPDQVLFLQDDTGAARVELLSLMSRAGSSTLGLEHEPQTQLEPGERVELIAVRFDDKSPRTILYDGEFRRIGRGSPPVARPASVEELRTFTNAHRLVTLKARVLGSQSVSGSGGGIQTWRLEADGRSLQARFDGPKLPEEKFPPQTWVIVTGVQEVTAGEWPDWHRPTLRLRNAADLALAPAPPFWSRPEYRHILPVGVTIGLSGLILLILQRWQMGRLERRVAVRTTELSTANAQLKEEVAARERAETEVQRALAQEKQLSELKSRFVAMVSHEFRTPLGIISSSAEILDAYLDRLSPDERRENLRDITDATRHMSHMMEEVLLLGRVEAGKLACRPAALDLAVFGQRLVDEVTSATNNRCSIQFKASGLPEAQADEALLRHILTNLLSNAAKYSAPGNVVEFTLEAREHLALFTVRDTGIGIPEADARLIFQAFHRGRNVGDTPGTGLGMIIVKRCVELHGGKIAFRSKEGRGTTFVVALPLFGPVPGGNGEGATQFFRAALNSTDLTFIS